MGYIQIKSTNKDLSYILEKAPHSGLQTRENNKKGVFFFWFSKDNNSTFNIYFKDPSEEISYPEHVNQQFEYLSAAKYNNARIVNDAISEILRSTREKDNSYDTPGHKHEFFINLLETQFKTIDIFQRYFTSQGFDIEYKEISKDNYQMIFSTSSRSFRELINLVNLFAIIATLNSDDFTFITEDLIIKYVKIAAFLDAPYFIRYLIKVKLMRSEKKFENSRKLLEQSKKFKFEIIYGDTHDMRIQWIKHYMPLTKNILDIGTGKDHRYLRLFGIALKSAGLKYFAVETDVEAREAIGRYVKYKKLEETVEIFESLEHFLLLYNAEPSEVNILCTEVLEHNELSEAKEIVKELVKLNFERILITVPNSDFNIHYGLDKFRHPDHKWESSEEQFTKDFQGFINDIPHTITGVGDKVDGVSVSTGLLISKTEFLTELLNFSSAKEVVIID